MIPTCGRMGRHWYGEIRVHCERGIEESIVLGFKEYQTITATVEGCEGRIEKIQAKSSASKTSLRERKSEKSACFRMRGKFNVPL
ncbi:unnamed protein product [Mycena citricolor]|uniref:Uncharacterized protein n=1 Tax=Mycena citricolor TaxID=2018698 RepID=A0AAD2K7A8_9AGAR|nr:unnamed protein product [Mycena citricolor]CAK5283105.1 unnamed protein product [Mycena citricolor]